MNVSAPFIRRPVATTLLAVAVVLAGGAAYTQLPVAQLPRVDLPTISVNTGSGDRYLARLKITGADGSEAICSATLT